LFFTPHTHLISMVPSMYIPILYGTTINMDKQVGTLPLFAVRSSSRLGWLVGLNFNPYTIIFKSNFSYIHREYQLESVNLNYGYQPFPEKSNAHNISNYVLWAITIACALSYGSRWITSTTPNPLVSITAISSS
jgi:hypothetical protein